ncbi:helicase C-terminal domain-containing protein [Levilactobacillus bambusae]|uniref:3'-5' exonuclease DinG n=1 Tax=Levilactobacillus bambusae TaxID=2024736 RepID=A0A2V1N2J3_9LACO|nr:helicase C-terminal domain-containing protein [Levilactobacillus bambusae]PWG01113.1 DNA helicase [Levilactobacillus bambusae]
MNNKTIYAVVDIETTGTSVKDGDRIIQIGCVFIQNHKIINRFATDVNPERAIPAAIERLTGITNKRVKKAPLFDDIAGTLYSLLTNTVFVAHNVNFDLPFINAEFERVGYPILEIEAVDTVSLSQILMPTATSFRLRDLSRTLAIEHRNPHSADSDADATAQLFIHLLHRLRQLPIVTLQQMVDLRADLPRDTADLFGSALELNLNRPKPLPKGTYIKNGLALRESPSMELEPLTPEAVDYPKTKRQKLRLMPADLTWRAEQSKMMNLIYKNYHDTDQHPVKTLLVEAPTGLGKSLGYGLPFAYLTQVGGQTVVSTATTLLQEQFKADTIPALNAIVPFNVSAVIVKGNRHYIDLNRFALTLAIDEPSKQTQLLKLRLLVWLTQTTTGDLDELHLATYSAPYFSEIVHGPVESVPVDSPFYADDFLRRRNRAVQSAQFVIVNHAYLAEHAQALGELLNQPYLVIDEAQDFVRSTIHQRRSTIRFSQIINAIHHVQRTVKSEHGRSLTDTFVADAAMTTQLVGIDHLLLTLDDAIQTITHSLYHKFIGQHRRPENDQTYEQLVDRQALSRQFADLQAALKVCRSAGDILLDELAKLRQKFEGDPEQWEEADDYAFTRFERYARQLDELLAQMLAIVDESMVSDTANLFWLTLGHAGDQNSLQLSGGLLSTEGFLSRHVYQYFQPPLFTGATLFSSKRSTFLLDRYDLDREQVATHRLHSNFDYRQQAELLVATDGPDVAQVSNRDYVSYLVGAIEDLAGSVHKQTMVLFNSLSLIQEVYDWLTLSPVFQDREILAQGVTGSRERIAKRFSHGTDAILLGAGSFWEGVDLPNEQLELLLITRLPFESPDQVFVKAEYNRLTAEGKSPFYNAALPKATLRLRQGVGRLIRTDQDTGAIVILDRRLIDKPYGKSMLNALPADLPMITGTTEQLRMRLVNFFENSSGI